MAIWIWIIAACLLSYLALGKEKVSFEHLIWLLLPVDMYGISIAGATLKPYMLFSVLLLLRLLLQRNEKLVINSWVYISGLLSFAVVLVNIFNTQTSSSPKAALLLLIVWGCVVLYLLNCGQSTTKDIPNAMIAAGIGYGIVFIIGYIFMKTGVNFPGILASNRSSVGFFMEFSNVQNEVVVYSYRLRGFTVDPNTMIGTFAFCAACCILRIVNGSKRIREWLGLIISGICVLMSNSRMGVLCFAFLALISFIISYRIAPRKVKNTIQLLLLFFIGVSCILFIATDLLQKIISYILDMYYSRAKLNDQHGRFTIWRNALSVLFEQNPLFGIGLGQMRYYTATGKDCHNTWLDMICANGLIVGSALLLHFINVMFISVNIAKNKANKLPKDLLWSLIIGMLTVMLSLLAVDNLTYSYLWFSTSLLSAAGEKFSDTDYRLNGKALLK